MRRQILTSLLFGAAVLIRTELRAQQPAPPNLDAIPEKMPFSNPYGAPIGAQRAESLIEAAAAEATKKGWAMNIAVVDSGANLVAFLRMDGCAARLDPHRRAQGARSGQVPPSDQGF